MPQEHTADATTVAAARRLLAVPGAGGVPGTV
jgi:hypothetical protein